MAKQYDAEIVQDGLVVAGASGPDLATVHREIMHYWMRYQQDGPCEIRWKNMHQADYDALVRHLSGADAPMSEERMMDAISDVINKVLGDYESAPEAADVVAALAAAGYVIVPREPMENMSRLDQRLQPGSPAVSHFDERHVDDLRKIAEFARRALANAPSP